MRTYREQSLFEPSRIRQRRLSTGRLRIIRTTSGRSFMWRGILREAIGKRCRFPRRGRASLTHRWLRARSRSADYLHIYELQELLAKWIVVALVQISAAYNSIP